jgi:hypothetical protein
MPEVKPVPLLPHFRRVIKRDRHRISLRGRDIPRREIDISIARVEGFTRASLFKVLSGFWSKSRFGWAVSGRSKEARSKDKGRQK